MEKNQVFKLRLSEEDRLNLQALADERYLSVAALIRQLVRDEKVRRAPGRPKQK